MEFSFENLLYDHSLTPLWNQPEEKDGRKKSGYPGTDKIIAELGAVRATSTAEIYKLNSLYFQLRYSSVGQSAFGGVPRSFSENIDKTARKLIVAIQKEEDAEKYRVGRVDLSMVKNSASWSTSGALWSEPLTRDKTDERILRLIREEAGV